MIEINFVRPHAKQTHLENPNLFENRIGFWADVVEVDSTQNKVNVVSDVGHLLQGIPVVSNEWVCSKNEERNYLTASRNLPPIGARVFVLTPNQTISSAFVLCSGFPQGEPSTKTYFADSKNKSRYTNERFTKTMGGWELTENYKTGNINLVSKDKDISVGLNCSDDNEVNLNKGISIKAYGVELKINSDKSIELKTNDSIDINCNSFSINGSDFTVGGGL